MEMTDINVLIKPIVDGNNTNPFLTTKEFESSINVDSSILLKDICTVVLEQHGLGLLSQTSEAYIKTSDSKYINCNTFYPNKGINLDIVQNLIGKPFTIVIFAHGKIENFCEVNRKNNVDCNLEQYIPPNNNFPNQNCFKENLVEKPSESTLLQSKEKILNKKNLLDSLLQGSPFCLPGDQETSEIPKFPASIERSISGMVVPNNNHNSSTKPKAEIFKKSDQGYLNYTPSRTGVSSKNNGPILGVQLNVENYFKRRQALIRTPLSRWSQCKSSKQKLEQPKEVSLLKQFYQKKRYPSTSEIMQYTKKINTITKRTGSLKITPYQVFVWFQERRNKEELKKSCADQNITF